MRLSLKASRVNANLSQKELGDILDVTRYTVNKWESGEVELTPSKVKKWCDACKVTVDDIFLPDGTTLSCIKERD